MPNQGSYRLETKRMNIRAFHFLFFLLTPFIFFAQQISDREATDIAVQVLGKSVKKCGQGNQLKNPVLNGDKREPLSTYDIFTGEDGNGFVIVSRDRRAPKVIGYGSGKWDPSILPPQLAAILANQDSIFDAYNALNLLFSAGLRYAILNILS